MTQHHPPRPAISRRRFLHHSAAAGAAAFAAPTIIPASALGRAGSIPPSERIVMGAIGIGGRGSHVLSWMMGEPDVRFVAVCDVRKERRQYMLGADIVTAAFPRLGVSGFKYRLAAWGEVRQAELCPNAAPYQQLHFVENVILADTVTLQREVRRAHFFR